MGLTELADSGVHDGGHLRVAAQHLQRRFEPLELLDLDGEHAHGSVRRHGVVVAAVGRQADALQQAEALETAGVGADARLANLERSREVIERTGGVLDGQESEDAAGDARQPLAAGGKVAGDVTTLEDFSVLEKLREDEE